MTIPAQIHRLPNPSIETDSSQTADNPPQEDLSQPVPLGESADDGSYIIHNEDPEYGPDPGPEPD